MSVQIRGALSGNPQGQLLVLGPSLGTSTAVWAPCQAILEQQFRVLSFDLPGHGRSPAAKAPFSIKDLADALIAMIDDAGATEFLYAGISLGGVIGLELLRSHGARVSAAAIICSAANIGTPKGWQERAATVRTQGTPVLIDQSAKRWVAPGFMEAHPQAASALLHTLSTCDDASYAWCCEALGDFDARPNLGHIQHNVLAIAGEHDQVTPYAQAQFLAAHLPHGRAVNVADAAHLAPLEQPAVVAQLLSKFFAQPQAVPEQAPTYAVAKLSDEQRRAAGFATRSEVLGEAHVAAAKAKTTAFTSDFQDLITRYAWGDVWQRPGLSRDMRSVAVLTALIAGGHWSEFEMHLHAAIRNGLSVTQIQEVILQSAIYCSVPSANHAFSIANTVFGQAEQPVSEHSDQSQLQGNPHA